MKRLLESYWNIMFYCTYLLLFYFFNRLLNPIYWLQNKNVKPYINEHISNILLFLDKQETDERGIDSWIVLLSLSSVCISCLCFFSIIFLFITKIIGINILGFLFKNRLVLVISFLIICSIMYILNHLFLFKKNKYESYFVEFNKRKKYKLYYSVYFFSWLLQGILMFILINC